MVQRKKNFVCQECGASHTKWSGQCTACGSWNTIVEELGGGGFSKVSEGKSGAAIAFESLADDVPDIARIHTNIAEFDRVLGGGLVAGSAILIGGDPGIGKSTLLLQVAATLAKNTQRVAYITGEESADQVRLRARRLSLDKAPVDIAAATSVDDMLASFKKSPPQVIIIDSIQTMFLSAIESAPGTVSQVRGAAHELISYAKANRISLFLVGHVTKEGQIAGPKVLEHMVDTVLYFEGERGHPFRILRAVKNRFGGANEIGVFEMADKGLSEVPNPSSLFISGKAGQVSGSAIFAGMEGSRPVLVEIQALVSPSPMAMPRRAVVGWDGNRLAMVLAVLGARAGINLADKEVYLNVAGGLRINEPAADLAVAAAIVSSLAGVALPQETVVFGEIGLSGEIRPVGHGVARLKEAEKLGFSRALVPPAQKGLSASSKNFILQEIRYIKELKNSLA
ncbi:MAG: DNA repair protein RadA [Proteobacteria bacterium]|nr:DNA repair protein RadA [Pseudomonadota bacterium]